jgi:hypothetical protein
VAVLALLRDDRAVNIGKGSPRHLGGGEELSPEYRVSFWQGPHVEEWETVTEADVDEVLAWATAEADGRPYSVWARSIHPGVDGKLLADEVRLFGVDPPTGDREPSWAKRPSWPVETFEIDLT